MAWGCERERWDGAELSKGGTWGEDGKKALRPLVSFGPALSVSRTHGVKCRVLCGLAATWGVVGHMGACGTAHLASQQL